MELMFRLLMFFVMLFFLTSCSYNLVGFGAVASDGGPLYASSIDFFSEEVLFDSSLVDDSLVVSVNPGGFDDFFVYRTAYVSVSDWVSFKLSAHDSSLQSGSWNDSWIKGSAVAELSKDDLLTLLDTQDLVSADELFVVVFVCRLYDYRDLSLFESQRDVLDSLFGGFSGYLCGVADFTSDGVLMHNRWSLETVDVDGFFSNPVAGVCGANAQDFSYEVVSWPSADFCSEGVLVGDAPSFPALDGSVSWVCEGLDGGVSASCTASRILSCDDAHPPSWSRKLNCLFFTPQGTECATFDGLFSAPSPGSGAFFTARDEFIALALPSDFRDKPQSFRVQINANEGQLAVNHRGPKVWTISACPGDFNRERIETLFPGCFLASPFHFGGFAFGGLDAPHTSCNINFQDPDLPQLYLNMVYATPDSAVLDDPASWEWTCGVSTLDLCGENLDRLYSGS